MPAARILRFLFLVVIGGIRSSVVNGQEAIPEQFEFFEKKVRPLLIQHCFECHSQQSKKLKAGLLLDSREGMLRGGDSGPAIVPSDPKSSLLISAIHYENYEMPPKGKLSDPEIQIFEEWIERGSAWPHDPRSSSEKSKTEFDLEHRKADHWVWQPIKAPAPPVVANGSWCRNEIDPFILVRLEQAKLAPAAPIDRRGLIRRLYFDLIGLPPTIEQTEVFLADQSPKALERLVDQLLDSLRFGERWGRHWLDLVRYSESRGHEFDYDSNNAYQYRDYVIRALNADVPYDQFVREHIAGDLLSQPRMHPQLGFNESILGTGFWFFGEWVHSPVDIRKEETDRFDNMIDVLSKTFLGLTVGCARCHDHKFDAISSRDYYALSGFLQSSDYRQVRFESIEKERRMVKELERIDQKYRSKLNDKVVGLLDGAAFDPKSDSASEVVENEKIDWSNAPQSPFRTLVDYRNVNDQEYLQDGFIYGSRPTRGGELILDEVDNELKLSLAPFTSARNDPFWHGLENQTETVTQAAGGLDYVARSGRTLRSPTVELERGTIDVLLRGYGTIVACVDSYRQIAGPLHKETIVKLEPGKDESDTVRILRWHSMNLERYVGHRVHFEFTPAENTVLEVLRIVELDPSMDQIVTESKSLDDYLADWKRNAIFNRRLQHLLESSEDTIPVVRQCRKIVADWIDERARLEQSLPRKSQLAMAMFEGSSEDDRLLIRGNSSNPGAVVTRRFLEAVDGPDPMSLQSRSGRLELADRINDPSNPLACRVIVNRIWHHLMGRGIVPTTDDFGVLGQRPTHPELLDYLATEFQKDGRSIKKMIRRVVLSQTYQMSSEIAPRAALEDPNNMLWHHIPPKRLEGEIIRDALLVLGGNLQSDPYGPSIPIHWTDFMEGRGRPKKNGPSDGAGRRSIYIAVRRNFLSPFMLAFDTPSPFSTMGRRNVSNVPAQALILMNDPFVAKQAEGLAARSIEAYPDDIEARIGWLYATIFVRHPRSDEQALTAEFVRRQLQNQASSPNELSIWSDVVHSLINTKEFIFLR